MSLSSGLRSRVYAKLKYVPDTRDEDGIYAELRPQYNAGYCIAPDYTSCTAQWFDDEHVKTTRWKEDYFSTYLTASRNVSPNADFARALVRICEDIPSWPDDCISGWAYTKGNAY